MPRRKIVRTVEEEEEFQRIKRERKAKWQIKKREVNKQIMKNCQSSSINISEIYPNVKQTCTNVVKNIVIDSHAGIISLPMKAIHSINETVITSSQTIGASTTNIPMIKNNNEITAINNSLKLFNVDDTIMEILPNNNIIFPVPSTSNKLINLDNGNRLEDNTFNKSNLTFSKNNLNNKSKVANYIERTRALKKGYTELIHLILHNYKML